MRRETFYLDTNVFSRLGDTERTDPEIPRRIAGLVRSGECEIIGAREVIEEFAGMATTKPCRFAQSLAVFWSLVGENVLRGRKRLLMQEIRKGCMLSRSQAFLDANAVNQIRSYPMDRLDVWRAIAEEVRGQGSHFTCGMHDSAGRLQELMLETDTAKTVRQLASRVDIGQENIRDWFHDVAVSNREAFGLPKDEAYWPNVGRLPCVRAFVSIMLALTKKHHMANKHRYREADQHDVTHYTNAAMAGCLVTDDRSLRDTCQLISWRAYPVIDTSEFLETTKRM